MAKVTSVRRNQRLVIVQRRVHIGEVRAQLLRREARGRDAGRERAVGHELHSLIG
jgi:hypothetical protein